MNSLYFGIDKDALEVAGRSLTAVAEEAILTLDDWMSDYASFSGLSVDDFNHILRCRDWLFELLLLDRELRTSLVYARAVIPQNPEWHGLRFSPDDQVLQTCYFLADASFRFSAILEKVAQLINEFYLLGESEASLRSGRLADRIPSDEVKSAYARIYADLTRIREIRHSLTHRSSEHVLRSKASIREASGSYGPRRVIVFVKDRELLELGQWLSVCEEARNLLDLDLKALCVSMEGEVPAAPKPVDGVRRGNVRLD